MKASERGLGSGKPRSAIWARRSTARAAIMRGIVPLLLVLIFSLQTAHVCAQSPVFSLNHFKHSRWTQEDGAPIAIADLAQTPDGFLWMTSADGLFRFDGVTFEHVSGPAGSPMEHGSPTRLLVTRSGALVVGYHEAGVAIYRDGRLQDMHMPNPPPQVTDIAEGADGAIWVVYGGVENRLNRFWRGKWQSAGNMPGLPDGMIVSMISSPNGTLWTSVVARGGTQGWLAYLRPGQKRFGITGDRLSVSTLALDRHGHLWAADSTSTRSLDAGGAPQSASVSVRYPAVPGLRLASIAFDKWGGIWGSTRTNGIFYIAAAEAARRNAPDAVERFRAVDGLTSDESFATLVDREGNVWISTGLGLDRFQLASVVPERSIPADAVAGLAIAGSNDGTIYIHSKGTLFAISPGGAPRPVMAGLAGVNSLCPARNGGVWIVETSGLIRLRADRRELFPVPKGGLVSFGCGEDRAGRLWVSLQDKIAWHDAGGWHDGPAAVQNKEIWDLAIDPAGDVVFSLGHDRLARIHDNRLTLISPEQLKLGNISAIASGPSDLLVSGSGGIVRLRGQQIRRLDVNRLGEASSARGLVQSVNGETWILRGKGIYRLPTAALDRAFEDSKATVQPRLLDIRDGLTSTIQHAGFRGPQIMSGADGRVWALTTGGVFLVDPRQIVRNEIAPPVVIRSLSSHSMLDPRSAPLRLPAGTTAVDIAYTAPSLSAPDRVRFCYRLNGVDDHWVDPGRRREASYANLRPGKYSFQLIAANNDGVWNRKGATIYFIIEPAFHQSWWFWIACALVAGLVLRMLYKIRMRRVAEVIRRRMEERIDERERIARELHDTLLQGFQGLMLRFQRVADRMPSDRPEHRMMEQALERADDVLLEGRERVRGLRTSATPVDLVAGLRAMAEEAAASATLKIEVTAVGEPRPVCAPVADEILQISNEALFNVVQHAHASHAMLVITFTRQQILISISDDGIGMNPAVRAAGGRDRHFGLMGMRERADEIRAQLAIRSNASGGTEVVLTVSAAIAYASKLSWWRVRRRHKEIL